ncbi:MAG: class I SAM-dependent methyltransferase [Gemmatimonadaceae bacterium]
MNWTAVQGSFRDPSGFLYRRNGVLYRQVNAGFREQFEALNSSGLYAELTADSLLIRHRQVDPALRATPEAHAVLEPEIVKFISYPYEWCFGQLKDAALLTLELQLRALKRNMVLRDASAFNVQFRDGSPIFIDTLSFEQYVEGEPWGAYKQFCEHFLAPLAIMSGRDIRLGQTFRDFIDGIPLDFASHLLPTRSWFRTGLLLHLHLHARAQRKYADAKVSAVARGRKLSRLQLTRLIDSLRSAVDDLSWRAAGTEWADYVHNHNYSPRAVESKQGIVAQFLSRTKAALAWDMGANTGIFSRIARRTASCVVAMDMDPAAVQLNYEQVKAQHETGILPLIMDARNPAPALGWDHRERMSLAERGPADVVLALALVHHLAIGNNVPLNLVAGWLARLARVLIIEFVPKNDSQTARLLANRPDVFPHYTQEGFEQAFAHLFELEDARRVEDSERVIYRMRAKPERQN